ncbi:MAG: MASE1 domain-containing protein [Opitutae bacterium]|nr:MASE1 domain-containing protein [Opitutae bacterium]
MSDRREFARWLWRTCGLGLAYVVSGHLGMVLPQYANTFALIWLPAGFAVAALWQWGPRVWPGVFLGTLTLVLLYDPLWPDGIVYPVANTLGAVLSARLLRRWGFDPQLQRWRDLLVFGSATSTGALLGTTAGTSLLYLFVPAAVSLELRVNGFLTWWISNAMGVLLLTPVLLAGGHQVRALLRRQRLEFLLWWASALALCLLPLWNPRLPLSSLAAIPVVWAAMRFGRFGTALGVLVIGGGAIFSVALGVGPFASGPARTQLFAVSLYVAAVLILGWLVFALQQAHDRKETALRESERLLRESQLFAGLGSYVMTLPEGRWESSPVLDQVFGLDATYERSMAGWVALLHPDDRASFASYLEHEVLGQGQVFDREFRIIRHHDRAERWVHGLGKLQPANPGHPPVMHGLIHDITARKLLEEQLRQSQKLDSIGQLAGGIAHDFNNLLTAILGNTSLLRAGGATPAEQAASLEQIALAGNRAAELTRQLLLFSRQQAPDKHVLDLNDTVTQMAKILGRILGEQVRLQLQCAPQPQPVLADSGMLGQILLNLAVNARDAMPGGGRLTLRTGHVADTDGPRPSFDPPALALHRRVGLARVAEPGFRPGEYTCLSVSDEGCGMTPEVLARIFEPFFTTKDVGGGTGLGLATVYGIAQQHQGWIEVDSQPGRGSTFRLFLPRPLAPIQAAPVPSTPPSAAGQRETILLVEDEATVRSLLQTVLTRAGYRVIDSPSGAAALLLWPAHRAEIRLLLTDIVMPDGVSGTDLAQRLLAEQPALKVILMSGYHPGSDRQLAALGPDVEFIAKPFPPDAILQLVQKQLAASTPRPPAA